MERLMRLVVAQGETIQTQLRRLNQRETQIETYEEQMHLLRVQNLGNDYLLSSYLHDQQNQPQEYPGIASHNQNNPTPNGTSSSSNPPTHTPTSGTTPTSRSSNEDSTTIQQSYQITNNSLMPGVPIPREVHARPIQLQNFPNEFNSQFDDACTDSNLKNVFGTNNTRLSGRKKYGYNDDTLVSEEKSNDSGVVLVDDILGSSVEERPIIEIEDFTEEEVQERLALLSKMEDVLTRLLHEEEVIQGLSSTVEVVQTQRIHEATDLNSDLKRTAEEHALLVAEARSNEQQIRVLDNSAAQKKKLIDALLQEEVDSDQQTQSLQAHLDYILHLPPTAFRLPEEGDDPPPLLPLPPAYPASLVQSLIHNNQQQPPLLVVPSATCGQRIPYELQQNQQSYKQPNLLKTNNNNNHTINTSRFPMTNLVIRPPSPNPVYANRAPSPNLFAPHRAPSPIVRNSLNNRSCSPTKRKQTQPPPYNHNNNNKQNFINNGSKAINRIQDNCNRKICNNSKSICSKNNCQCPSTNNNNLKNLLSGSLPCLPNKPNSVNNNTNILPEYCDKNSKPSSTTVLTPSSITSDSSNTTQDESCDDIPPPLPSCPPPSFTPPPLTDNNINNNNTTAIAQPNINTTLQPIIFNDTSKQRQTSITATNGSRIIGTTNQKRQLTLHEDDLLLVDEDDYSRASSSSLCVSSSRSSTASDNSISNCSSGSSATANEAFIHSKTYINNETPTAKLQSITCNTNTDNNNIIHNINNNTRTENVVSNNNRTGQKFFQQQQQKNQQQQQQRCNDLKQSVIINGSDKMHINKKDPDSGDSNSDTGLSSLHSSSDEGCYSNTLDTLV